MTSLEVKANDPPTIQLFWLIWALENKTVVINKMDSSNFFMVIVFVLQAPKLKAINYPINDES
jgi:hypothetical protein